MTHVELAIKKLKEIEVIRTMIEPRKLTGIFFRIKRGDHYESIDFTDMTLEEQMEILKSSREKEFLINMCVTLASTIRQIGDELNLVKEYGDD